jgi:tryptophan-rich sensory protein
MSPNIIAFLCCLGAAVLEGVLSGGSAKSRFAGLQMPAFSPSFPIWIVIGLAYYALCFLLLRYLFAMPERSPSGQAAIGLIIVVLVCNGIWNYLFFRRRSLRASFVALFPYSLLVFILTGMVFQLYPLGGWLLTCYGLYLIYATWWAYRLSQLNDKCA